MGVDLYSLAYFSRNALAADAGVAEDEIERILTVARCNNIQNDVTGALLYSRCCFAQVLEGSLAAVEAIFEKIQLDPRHRDITVLHFKPVEKRSFDRWSMAYAGCPDADMPSLNIEEILDNPEAINGDEAGQDVIGVLHELIAKHEIHEV